MTTISNPKPDGDGVFRPYLPERKAFRTFQRMPLLFWRLGWGPFVGRWMMVLTTQGRKSALPRHGLVNYYRIDGRKYAYSGFGPRSDWFRNLLAQPLVTLQTDDGVEPAVARRVVDPQELAHVMADIKTHYPAMATMIRHYWGDRPLTADTVADHVEAFYLVAFDPTAAPTPPPLAADLRRLSWLLGLGVVALLVAVVAALVR